MPGIPIHIRLRARFRPVAFASKAEEAGAEAIYGIAVESLVKDETGKVIGVKAGEDEITADVVLLCDGVNSLLTKQAVGAARPPASGIAVGIKQTIELPPSVITDRVLWAQMKREQRGCSREMRQRGHSEAVLPIRTSRPSPLAWLQGSKRR